MFLPLTKAAVNYALAVVSRGSNPRSVSLFSTAADFPLGPPSSVVLAPLDLYVFPVFFGNYSDAGRSFPFAGLPSLFLALFSLFPIDGGPPHFFYCSGTLVQVESTPTMLPENPFAFSPQRFLGRSPTMSNFQWFRRPPSATFVLEI